MSTSRLQEYTAKMLYGTFPQYTIKENYRPEWLQNPGGKTLELDFFIPELKIAIEVQGQQHYVFTPIFHNCYNDFLSQIKRDQVKRDICFIENIKLIEIDNQSQVDDLIKELSTPDYYLQNSSKPSGIQYATKLLRWQDALLQAQSKLDFQNLNESDRLFWTDIRDKLVTKIMAKKRDQKPPVAHQHQHYPK